MNNTDFCFRQYSDGDFDQVFNLFTIAFKVKDMGKSESKTKIEYLIKSSNYKIFVATNKNLEIVGGCVVYIHEDAFGKDFATLWYLAVDNQYQNKGIATGLIAYVVDILKDLNLESLRLTTNLDNYACQKASENAGLKKKICYEYMY